MKVYDAHYSGDIVMHNPEGFPSRATTRRVATFCIGFMAGSLLQPSFAENLGREAMDTSVNWLGHIPLVAPEMVQAPQSIES
jgi:hypothetical protein